MVQNKNLINVFLDFNDADNGSSEFVENPNITKWYKSTDEHQFKSNFLNGVSQLNKYEHNDSSEDHTNNQFALKLNFDAETPLKLKQSGKNIEIGYKSKAGSICK